MVVVDELNANRDPMLRTAPIECWTKLNKALGGKRTAVRLQDVDPKDHSKMFVVFMMLAFVRPAGRLSNVTELAKLRAVPPAERVEEPMRKRA